MSGRSQSENWFERRARYLAEGKARALQAGREAWNEATRSGRNVLARTEAEIEALGRQALAQQAAAKTVARKVVAPVQAGITAAQGAQASREKGDRLAGRQAVRTMGRVKSALTEDHPSTEPPPTGPLNRDVVDQRMHETQDELRRNYQFAAVTPLPGAPALAWPVAAASWVNKVRPGEKWDDKASSGFEAGEYQGNFSYGATAAALGLPLDVALRGAGAAQRFQNAIHAVKGRKFSPSVGGSSYGDDPRDQRVIKEGYAYGVSRLSQRNR